MIVGPRMTMRAEARQYDHETDFEKVSRFLVSTYCAGGAHINWPQPRWEYMHFHPLIRQVELGAIGVWEAGSEMVGMVHPEHSMGTAYFEIHPDYDVLKCEMLGYAEQHLSVTDSGVRRLRVYINDQDEDFQRTATKLGYTKGGGRDPMSHLPIPNPFPPIAVPDGLRLKSLAEGNDLRKSVRVLHRGFDHGGEPPTDAVEDLQFMQSAPNYRKELNVVAVAHDGSFVSYCGMWYEALHKVAYVEPVATDPAYRRMGLGRAVVLDGIRRCGELGARLACVGSVSPFYLSLGFREAYSHSAWQREWTE
jgi:predicted N-acetyltransferase YhbS